MVTIGISLLLVFYLDLFIHVFLLFPGTPIYVPGDCKNILVDSCKRYYRKKQARLKWTYLTK